MALARVATCQLNQWALDFTGNLRRVRKSIELAKAAGARFRTGPELELPGYGCEDHFLESDTIEHSWEMLRSLLVEDDSTYGILCDIGMPVVFRGIRYNCRVFCLDGRVLLIRPKTDLSGDGNYREFRYFAAWNRADLTLYEFNLRAVGLDQQPPALFGTGVVECRNATVGSETCEELWTLQAPHTRMMLDGVDIIANGSSSHHELRKLQKRLDLILSATAKGGGAYLYANQIGCDGGRLYYDGSALIAVNGQVVRMAEQFSLEEVTVICADVDLEQIKTFRCRAPSLMAQCEPSMSTQAPSGPEQRYPRVVAEIDLNPEVLGTIPPLLECAPKLKAPAVEIAEGPACWLWDYLRRSGAGGFFVPLSGGADSAAVATVVGSMCQMVCAEISKGNTAVRADAEKVLGISADGAEFPQTHRDLARRLLHTCYMRSENSSETTQRLAERLADEIGAFHLKLCIDGVVSVFIAAAALLLGARPRFRAHGGTVAEDMALQNIQARVRMVFAYLLASLLPWSRGQRGYLLVLGTANVDEALCGYLTKYDCSSADLNPIGSVSKVDIRRFLDWAVEGLGYSSLADIVGAVPSAELTPTTTAPQSDEEDMGMTYELLSFFGRARMIQRCGPVSLFRHLLRRPPLSLQQCGSLGLAEKVKHFFRRYCQNRHKMTTLTPSYHAESYSPEDNRYDHRQFLYPDLSHQHRRLDELAAEPQTH